MARSWAARRSSRSTSWAYLRASSAYLLRSASGEESTSSRLGIVPVGRLQRGDLRHQARHPGRVLEDDHRSENGALVDDGNGGHGGAAFGAVGELVRDLLRPQRRLLGERLA